MIFDKCLVWLGEGVSWGSTVRQVGVNLEEQTRPCSGIKIYLSYFVFCFISTNFVKKLNDTKNTFSSIVHNIPSISLYNLNSGRICTILFFSRLICQADGIQVIHQSGDEDHDPEDDLDLEARAENVENRQLGIKSRLGGKIIILFFYTAQYFFVLISA